MDWRVLLTTFGIIFLAEMGDKTQLAAMTMAAEKKRQDAKEMQKLYALHFRQSNVLHGKVQPE